MRRKAVLGPSRLLHAPLAAIALANVFPIFWMISSALKLPMELFTSALRLLPLRPTLENFRVALFDYEFPRWLSNSVITTMGIAVGQMIVAILAAFAICYFKTRYNRFVFNLLIGTMVIPFQVTMIPNYILISKLGLLNTAAAVIIPNLVSASTFFFVRQHFKEIPIVFHEAAVIEGADSAWVLTNVFLPICKSSVAAMFILCVIDGWNQFFWPLLVLSKPESRTLTVGLQQFLDHESGNRWGPFMATATLASLPIMVLFLFIQKSIIEAFIDSGIKG
jgi:sn-glycerol 3-phosphate transport system permease protein